MAASVFVLGIRTYFARMLMQQPLFVAVGEGDPAWDDVPPPSTPEEEAQQLADLAQKTALESCVGFARLRSRSFVQPDDAGTIVVSDGSKWSKTADPTRYLMIEALLDLTDATGVKIRETGVYADTQFAESVQPGQMYVPIADVTELGTLLQLHRFPPIVRDGSLTQAINPILEF